MTTTDNNDKKIRYNDDDWLPSYRSIRQKTIDLLYGSSGGDQNVIIDKSPKGCVDEPIQELVDLINLKLYPEVYATLSSCSGRTVIFQHPKQHKQHKQRTTTATVSTTTTNPTTTTNNQVNIIDNDDNDDNNEHEGEVIDTNNNNNNIVKGGKWLLVEHTPVDPNKVLKILMNDDGDDDITSCLNHDDEHNNDRNDDNNDHNDISNVNNDNTNVVMDDMDEENEIDDNDDNIDNVTMKFEPALLHIAACNIYYGQILLQLALQCGYRESGLIVTSNRITVAIRSNSLQLSIPFTIISKTNNKKKKTKKKATRQQYGSSLTTNPLLLLPPSREYIIGICHNANERLLQNWNKLQKLYNAIQKSSLYYNNNNNNQQIQNCLYQYPSNLKNNTDNKRNPIMNEDRREKLKNTIIVQHDDNHKNITSANVSYIPDLNLWNHGTITTNVTHKNDNNNKESLCIVVFGGYGCGPNINISNNNNNNNNNNTTTTIAPTKTIKRSDHIYCLRQRLEKRKICISPNDAIADNNDDLSTLNEPGWNTSWEKVTIRSTTNRVDESTTTKLYHHGIEVIDGYSIWGPRESLTSSCCYIPSSSNYDQSSSSSTNSNDNNNLIILFGGRTNPSHPLNDLLFFELKIITTTLTTTDADRSPLYYQENDNNNNSSNNSYIEGRFYSPVDVRGIKPSPRWGHTMTSLNNSIMNHHHDSISHHFCFVLIGGRNEKDLVEDSIYTLTIIEDEHKEYNNNDFSNENIIPDLDNSMKRSFHLLWEQVHIPNDVLISLDVIRFHHCSVTLDDETILVFGGLTSCNDNLLQPFASSDVHDNDDDDEMMMIIPSFIFTRSNSINNNNTCHDVAKSSTTKASVNLSTMDSTLIEKDIRHSSGLIKNVHEVMSSSIGCRFGHSACVISTTSEVALDINNSIKDGTITSQQVKQVDIIVGGGVTIPSSFSIRRRKLENQKDIGDSIVYRIRAIKEESNNVWTVIKNPILLLPDCHDNDLSNLGPLVHHGCVTVPVHVANPKNKHMNIRQVTSSSTSDSSIFIDQQVTVAMVGGGVIGFAFGPCYSKSFLLNLNSNNHHDRLPVDVAMQSNMTNDIQENRYQVIATKQVNRKQSHRQTDNSARTTITQNDIHKNKHEPSTDVLYVRAIHAKQLKVTLEKMDFINKRYRMTKIDMKEYDDDNSIHWFDKDLISDQQEHLIAVPVLLTCINLVNTYYSDTFVSINENKEWITWILGIGKKQLPYSSSAFARKHTSPYMR